MMEDVVSGDGDAQGTKEVGLDAMIDLEAEAELSSEDDLWKQAEARRVSKEKAHKDKKASKRKAKRNQPTLDDLGAGAGDAASEGDGGGGDDGGSHDGDDADVDGDGEGDAGGEHCVDVGDDDGEFKVKKRRRQFRKQKSTSPSCGDGKTKKKKKKKNVPIEVDLVNERAIQAAELREVERVAWERVAKDDGVDGLDELLSVIDPNAKVYFDPLFRRVLKPHQVEGVRFLWNGVVDKAKQVRARSGADGEDNVPAGCILAHCMGLGKTLQLITFCYHFHHRKIGRRELIVVPKNVIPNWRNEVNHWVNHRTMMRRLPLWSFEGSTTRADKADMLENWFSQGGILLLGYEQMTMLFFPRASKDTPSMEKQANIDRLREVAMRCLRNPGPDLVILDEGHRIKDPKSKVSIVLKAVRTLRRVAATGYPLQNNLREYWCMMDWVQPGFLGSLPEFCERFVEPIEAGQLKDAEPVAVECMKRRLFVLHDLVKDLIHRRDVSILARELPPKREYVLSVKLTKAQVILYKAFVRWLRAGLRKAKILSLFHTSLQLCCHPDIVVAKKPRPEFVEGVPGLSSYVLGRPHLSAKIVLTLRIIRSCYRLKEKLLLFSQSTQALDMIETFLRQTNVPESDGESWEEGVNYFRFDGSTGSNARAQKIRDFNESFDVSKFNLFMISTKAGSLGINLPSATRIIIFDPCWNPSHDVQAIFRCYRYGQTKPVFVYRFVAHKTIEQTVYNRQVKKEGLFQRVVDSRNPIRSQGSEALLIQDFVEEHDDANVHGAVAPGMSGGSWYPHPGGTGGSWQSPAPSTGSGHRFLADLLPTPTLMAPALANGRATPIGSYPPAFASAAPPAMPQPPTERENAAAMRDAMSAMLEDGVGRAVEARSSQERSEQKRVMEEDPIAASLLRECGKWIVKIHRHESLLSDDLSHTQLTEAEKREATAEYDALRAGPMVGGYSMPPFADYSSAWTSPIPMAAPVAPYGAAGTNVQHVPFHLPSAPADGGTLQYLRQREQEQQSLIAQQAHRVGSTVATAVVVDDTHKSKPGDPLWVDLTDDDHDEPIVTSWGARAQLRAVVQQPPAPSPPQSMPSLSPSGTTSASMHIVAPRWEGKTYTPIFPGSQGQASPVASLAAAPTSTSTPPKAQQPARCVTPTPKKTRSVRVQQHAYKLWRVKRGREYALEGKFLTEPQYRAEWMGNAGVREQYMDFYEKKVKERRQAKRLNTTK